MDPDENSLRSNSLRTISRIERGKERPQAFLRKIILDYANNGMTSFMTWYKE
jgi:hypothetical protein